MKKLLKSFLLPSVFVFLTYCINTTTMSLFGEHITTGLTGPILEEFFRYVMILSGTIVGVMYTIIISSCETFLHLKNASFFSSTGDIIIARIFATCAHFTFLAIQLFGFHLSKKTGKQKYIKYGLIAAIILHMCWNSFLGVLVYEVFS